MKWSYIDKGMQWGESTECVCSFLFCFVSIRLFFTTPPHEQLLTRHLQRINLHFWRMFVFIQGAYQGFISISGGRMLLCKDLIKDSSPYLDDGCSYVKIHTPSTAFRLKEGCRKPVLGVWQGPYQRCISISGRWMLLGNISPHLEGGCSYARTLWKICLNFWGMDVVIQEAFIEDLSPFLEDGCC